jgi:RNA polymerase sigma-70 factor, ECF subfamily
MEPGKEQHVPDTDQAVVVDAAPTADDTVGLILAEIPFLRRLATSVVRQAADADDLVQETVFRAFRARDRFRPGSSIRAWLSTILIRASLTAALTRNRRGTCSWTDAGLAVDDLSERGNGEPSGEEACDFASVEQHLDDRLRNALLQLSAHYREPFCLYVLRGLTYQAIARRLGVPVGTVMSRIFRARSRLRTELAEMPAAVRARERAAAAATPSAPAPAAAAAAQMRSVRRSA